jgi:catechol 2,3-dioxygenase-like lactoylglutathione lyase family enzyme
LTRKANPDQTGSWPPNDDRLKETRKFPGFVKPKFTYVGIRVKDMDESIGFYSKLFGMKVAGRSKLEVTHGEVATLVSEKKGFPLELNWYEKKSLYDKRYTVGEGLDHLCFQVESIDETLAKAKKMGFRSPKQIRTKTSRWAYVEDPSGIWVEVFQ